METPTNPEHDYLTCDDGWCPEGCWERREAEAEAVNPGDVFRERIAARLGGKDRDPAAVTRAEDAGAMAGGSLYDDGKGGTYAFAVTDADSAGERLRDLSMTVEQAQHDLRLAVGALRAAGWSWTQVGEALGVRKQSAAEKFKTAAADWIHLQAGDVAHNDGREVRRVLRMLNVRSQRVRYEVRDKATGEVLRRHYVESRAVLEAGQELVMVDPRKPDYRREVRIRSVR